MLRHHRIRSLYRAWRDRQQAWARLRHERLRGGPHRARDQERAVLGALILEPALIRIMAVACPPAWFTDLGCLAIMQALFCLHPTLELAVSDVVDALESHGHLALVGGQDEVEALVRPGPRLDAARPWKPRADRSWRSATSRSSALRGPSWDQSSRADARGPPALEFVTTQKA